MVTIDISTFPAEGGQFTIQLTKEDNYAWFVTTPTAAWITDVRTDVISNYLYEMRLEIEENTNVSDRTVSFSAGNYYEHDNVTLTQYGTGTAVAADIIAQTPSGDMPAAGGLLTVDIYANGGDDSLSSAVASGAGVTLTSTTHGVSSGGHTCTRFVFTYSENTSTSPRSTTLTFTVSDGGGNTATAVITKAQKGKVVQSGSLSVAPPVVAANTAGNQNCVITYTDMVTSSLAVTTALGWLTSQSVEIVGNTLCLVLVYPANGNASARTQTITVEGEDIYGNTLTSSVTLTQQGTSAPTHVVSAAWDTDGILTYKADSKTATITYTGTFTGDASLSYPTLPDGLTIALTSNTALAVTWTGGNIPVGQEIPITIERTGNDSNPYSDTIYLTLSAGGIFPIWEDVFAHIVSDDDYEDYEIYEGTVLLYAGRAFAYPDEEDITVNISRVIAPYLASYTKTVDVEADGNTIGQYKFVRDYSYDPDMDYFQDQWLNRPITGKIPAGAKVSASFWTLGGSMLVTDGDGTVIYSQTVGEGKTDAEWISGSVGKTYLFGSYKYEVVDACHAAFLKYVNAYGAMDYFLVEGVSKKADKIVRSSYGKDAAALTPEFESKDYQAEMEAQWQGTTGWLTDEQSLLMKHLVESVEIYMVNERGEDVPVVFTMSSLDYKTWWSNGRRLTNYTLQWSESQKKYRR